MRRKPWDSHNRSTRDLSLTSTCCSPCRSVPSQPAQPQQAIKLSFKSTKPWSSSPDEPTNKPKPNTISHPHPALAHSTASLTQPGPSRSTAPRPPRAPAPAPAPARAPVAGPSHLSPTELATLRAKNAATDWSQCDPRITPSALFRLEFLAHGPLSHEQAGGKPFNPGKGKGRAPAFLSAEGVVDERPAWATREAVQRLAPRLRVEEEFVALLAGRDLVREGGARRVILEGADVYLVGREFPVTVACLVGMVVEATWKEDKVIYMIDDGTAVTECVCHLPPSPPIAPDLLPPRTPLPATAQPAGPPKPPPPVGFRVGTLVRAIGHVQDGWLGSGSDRTLAVNQVEALPDANAEVEHRCLVDKLHKEVYGRPFDVDDMLGRIEARREGERRAAQAEEAWEGSSQATASSVAGSPSKINVPSLPRLEDPRRLPPSMLTTTNFLVYLKQHLNKYHVSRVPGRTPHDAPHELPCAFTIANLAGAKKLARFATRLAQKRAAEKRQGRVRSVRGLPALPARGGEAWIKAPEREGVLERRDAGSRGGTSGFLPPPSVDPSRDEGERKRQRSERGREEKALSGAELDKAVRRVFVEGLQEMRRKGVIVTADPEEDERLGGEGLEGEGKGEELGSFELSERTIEGISWSSNWGASASTIETPAVEDFWLARLQAGDTQATPKASRSVRLELPTPRTSTVPTRSATPANPIPNASLGNLSTASWATSAAHALDRDAFLLVTTSFLARRLGEVLDAPSGAGRGEARLTDHEVRIRLARDERWRGVAECSELVEKARRELEQGRTGGGGGRGPQAERERAVWGGGW